MVHPIYGPVLNTYLRSAIPLLEACPGPFGPSIDQPARVRYALHAASLAAPAW